MHLKLPKIKIFKNEKICWRLSLANLSDYISYHHFTQCTKNHNQCTVPEIRSQRDQMFCHFGPFFPPFFSSYHIWFLKYKVQHLSFWVIFCLFCPLTTGKSNFKIEKNPWTYYHFTHLQHK